MQWAREPRGQAWHERARSRRAPAAPRPDPVILVVDDDDALRSTFAMVLTGLGPQVLEASGGNEALAVAAEHDLALVVLDSRMPDRSGFEVLAALRSRPATARVPVIFVTGVIDVSERVRALDAGAHDYLVKPVDVDELRARVQSHLARHQDRVGEEDRLRRLAGAAASICGAEGGTVGVLAAAACREIGQLHPTVDVALHAFMGHGVTEWLAEHSDGDTTPGGRPLDARTARRAHQRTLGGPWVETTHAGLVHVPSAIPVLPGPRTAAWVPLSTPGTVLGVVMISAEGLVVDDLIRRVTDAMVTATELAPSISFLLEPGLEKLTASGQRQARLQRLVNGAFFSVFQPVVDLCDRRVEGYQALARFEDGTRPELRLAEAASLGGLVELETALCRSALDDVPRLPQPAWVSLNVSPSLLLDTVTMQSLLDGHRGPPLVLEVTEHDRIDDYAAIRRAVDELGAEIRLSVDDVGDGWSCLRHVLDLQPSFVKLDTTWVNGIGLDPIRQALIRGLGHFSERAGCALIAEGVESESQLQTLVELEVCLGQGTYLGRPSRVEGFASPLPASP